MYFEDFKVGDELTSPGITVTEAQSALRTQIELVEVHGTAFPVFARLG